MKLKYIIFLILFNSCANSQNSKFDANIDTQEYHIDYPKDWKMTSPNKMNIVFCLYVETDESIGNFGENINLMIEDVKTLNLDIDKYTELSENQIKTNGKLIESKRILRNNLSCQQLMFEAVMNGKELKFRQYYFVEDGKAYVLTFTATKENFEKYISVSEKVMATFRIK